jgi:hypothetical protein
VTKALGKAPPAGGTYVINVYINHERRFAFVEFGSIPLTTACMAFGECPPVHAVEPGTVRCCLYLDSHGHPLHGLWCARTLQTASFSTGSH